MAVPKEMPKRIQMAYKDALDNIAFLKRQQWIITNYSFAAYAALYFLCKETHPNNSVRFLIAFIIVIVASYCVAVLSSFEDGMKKFRARLNWIYKNQFSRAEQTGMNFGEERPQKEKVRFSYALKGVAILGGIVAISAIAALPASS